MPDYQRGKIYKITSGDLTYIGSTCEPTLARRLSDHVSKYNREKNGNKVRGSKSSQVIEKGQYEITLIELCPCNSKDELTARERFHIETNECVNRNIPGRTHEEYEHTQRNQEERNERRNELRKLNSDVWKEKDKQTYIKYKESKLERAKTYYETNRDKINERRRLKRQLDKQNQTPS
jgi:hypothetical protein